ncbi:MAG: hypothetical protein GY798_10080 [Hyphomicrobiales bacterium]|nr:hypothetical protein [Hyphomicrobiales bacterium]
MFKLSRSGSNVPAEVQRWQYFLRTQGISQVGPVDSQFGGNTEVGTKIFQIQSGLNAHGRVDEATLDAASALEFRILNSNYYADRSSLSWPNESTNLRSPSNAWRNRLFVCFEFLQKRRGQRPDEESIVIKGSCDDSVADWEDAFIVNLRDDRLQFAVGYPGYIRCHRKAAPKIQSLLDVWEQESLLHLAINYAGCFVPRYMRGKAPHRLRGHRRKKSKDVSTLSNHSFGSAFDISTTWNWLGDTPAQCGQKGSVRELVESANAAGFYWGGHYSSRKDGMHFELTKL